MLGDVRRELFILKRLLLLGGLGPKSKNMVPNRLLCIPLKLLFLSLMVLVDWLDETFFGLDYHSKFAVVIGVILTLDKDHHGV